MGYSDCKLNPWMNPSEGGMKVTLSPRGREAAIAPLHKLLECMQIETIKP